MRQMYNDLLAEEVHQPINTFSIDNPPPYFIRLFEHAAQHQQFYRLLLCGDGVARFQKLIKEYIVDVVLANVRTLPPADQHLSVPLIVHAHFIAGAAISVLAWWLENGMPFSPHQMAQYLLSSHGM